MKEGLIIDPRGVLYKYWGLLGDERFSVGTIESNQDKPIYYKYMIRDPLKNPVCRKCDTLPFCNGGCLYEAYRKTGNMLSICCDAVMDRDALGSFIKLYVLSNYVHRLKKEGVL